jgi:flagellar assembly factor FliW
MHVETSRFGTLRIPEDEIVTFPEGLPGFKGRHEMALLGGGHLPGGAELIGDLLDGSHSLFWLQDVNDPDLAFLTIVPWTAYPDYDIEIDPKAFDAARPDAVVEDNLCVLAIVTVRREHGGVQLTSNLLAPVVIDTERRIGRQLILDDRSWPVHAPLAASGAGNEKLATGSGTT